MPDPRPSLARAGADAVRAGFESYMGQRAQITARARLRFIERDWRGVQRDARDRLDLRDKVVNESVGIVRAELGGAAHDRSTWARMKELYEADLSARPDAEIGLSYFNSVTRRVFSTVGVDGAIEFLATELAAPAEVAGLTRSFPRRLTTEALLRDILEAYALPVPYEDLRRDAHLAATELDAHLRTIEDRQPIESVDMALPVFFRGKGAYLVGRIRRGRFTTPLVLALVHGDAGVVLDAILFTPEDCSIVFSFTRSYFHVDVPSPRAMVAFLRTLMPLKRVSELYISLGFNRHGKAELYREIARHLEDTGESFVPARGDKGLVMSVFTLPGLDVVLKVIKDRFAPPKQTTRREVMDKYRHVFRHDRAGRLVDAQDFVHLAFPRSRFSAEVLSELSSLCGETVKVQDDTVTLEHLYAERRVSPLNLFIRERDEWTAREAVLDFGQALRDLAVTNTFPGDMLLKNFGVTRNGRVIFYDYDELTRVTDCRFRDMPTTAGAGPGGDDDDDLYGWGPGGGGGEGPSFYVGPDDIFPEEFLPFLGLPGRLKDVFLQAHGDLLTGRYWREVQDKVQAGEIVDIFPYRESQRLRYAR